MNKLHFSPLGLRLVFILCALAVAPVVAGEKEVVRLSEPVAATDTYEFFGAMLPEEATPISLAQLVENDDKYQDQEILLATRIAKVCQKKGCFFIAQEGANTARVSFKDYGFFIPSDSGGKEVVLLGTFSRKSVSKEEAEHYAADLGEKAVSKPERFEYSIVASAVKIPRS
jgi:hypothetical protein